MNLIEELRNDGVFTGRMALLLSDPHMQTALAALRDASLESNIERTADAIVSVRAESFLSGRLSLLSDLRSLAIAAPVEEKPKLPDFGTGIPQEDLAAIYRGHDD